MTRFGIDFHTFVTVMSLDCQELSETTLIYEHCPDVPYDLCISTSQTFVSHNASECRVTNVYTNELAIGPERAPCPETRRFKRVCSSRPDVLRARWCLILQSQKSASFYSQQSSAKESESGTRGDPGSHVWDKVRPRTWPFSCKFTAEL